jgi:hypothetical protein
MNYNEQNPALLGEPNDEKHQVKLRTTFGQVSYGEIIWVTGTLVDKYVDSGLFDRIGEPPPATKVSKKKKLKSEDETVDDTVESSEPESTQVDFDTLY